jgi:hypothetical protein
MKIKVIEGTNSDNAIWQRMLINGEEALSVYPLYECPEDAIIGRDLVSCNEVVNFMRQAYEAGKNGDEFSLTQENGED